MTAAVIAPAGDPTAADGLSVLLAVQRGSKYDPVKVLADPAAGTETIDTAGASRVVALIVNPAQLGDSKRPGFCFGDVDEIAACRAAFLGAGGAGGGGGGSSSSSSSSSSGGGARPASATPDQGGGCGCHAAPSTELGGYAFTLALAAMAALRRRREHRPSGPSGR
jgi:MYXO-CTERM domain-containing protein